MIKVSGKVWKLKTIICRRWFNVWSLKGNLDHNVNKQLQMVGFDCFADCYSFCLIKHDLDINRLTQITASSKFWQIQTNTIRRKRIEKTWGVGFMFFWLKSLPAFKTPLFLFVFHTLNQNQHSKPNCRMHNSNWWRKWENQTIFDNRAKHLDSC